MDVRQLFEAELARRGLRHAADSAPGRYVVWAGSTKLVVSLDNLARQLSGDDHDAERVAWFANQIAAEAGPATLTADGLYWHLEPNDYQHKADYRAAVSPKLDRVLVHAEPEGGLIRWVTARTLSELGLSTDEASGRAWSNLDATLSRAAPVSIPAPGGVTLLSFSTSLASKASLLLAPSLRDAISEVTGWPVLAVAPDRDFVYIWDAGHRELTARLGSVVTREHARAPYPLSTEILEIGDSIRAIGRYAA